MRKLRLISLVSWFASALLALPATAETEEKNRNFVCRPQVYELLVKAQKALQDAKYKEAEAHVERLQERIRLNDHEEALVLQTLGYVYTGQERLKLAAKTLRRSYDLDALPQQTRVSLLYTIGQLHMADQDFAAAVKTFDEWVPLAKSPSADALYTVAAANYQTKNYRAAIKHGERARKLTNKPKDGLLQLLLSSYVETKQYRSAIEVQSAILERHPEKKNHWIQLSALYGEVNEDQRALAVIELAAEAGVLEKSSEYVQYAQRLLSEEIPYEAGRVFEKYMEAGKIEKNPKNVRMLATAWMQSRNVEKAVPALGRAAKVADDGELYFRLAQLELEREEWDKAVAASGKALQKGGLKNPGQVHLIAGIAHMRAGHNRRARKSFEEAAKHASSRPHAKSWLKYLDNLEKT